MNVVSIRRQIFRHYALTGGPPTLGDDELHALETAHAVVLDDAGAIAFANPFATAPAPFRVETRQRVHHAICAWDALGVLAALHTDGTVRTQCPDCTDTIHVRVAHAELVAAEAVVHFLVPAARWYDNLGFA